MKLKQRKSVLVLSVVVLLGVTLRAQEAGEEGDIFELSPFEVSTSGDAGYVATSTLAGTRLNSSLRDVPASVSIFNEQFIEDVALKDTVEAIEYSVAFTQDTTANNGNNYQFNDINIRARGFSNSTQASRDFFTYFVRSDAYNTERFTFSRGPNSILFGTGDPGGVINTVTKRARFNDKTRVGLETNAYGSYRATLDYNKVVVDDVLAVRVNVLKEDEKTNRDHEYERQFRYHLTSTYRPWQKTTIRVDYEDGTMDRLKQRRWTIRDGFSNWESLGSIELNHNDYYANGVFNSNSAKAFAGTIGASYQSDPLIVVVDDGMNRAYLNSQYTAASTGNSNQLSEFDRWDKDTGMAGPVNTSDQDFDVFTAILQQQIGDSFHIEFAYNEQNDERMVATIANHQEIRAHVDVNETMPDGSVNPNFGRYFMQSAARLNPNARNQETIRITASYELDTGSKWFGRHQIAALYQDEDNYSRGQRINLANTTPLVASRNRVSQNSIFGRTYIQGGEKEGASGFMFNPVAMMVEPFSLTNPATGAVIGQVTPAWVTDRDRPISQKIESKMIGGQSFFWNDRFVITYGYREDELEQRNFVETTADSAYASANPGVLRDQILSTELGDASLFPGETKTMGAVYHLTDWLSFSGNYSTNFKPQTSFSLFNDNIGNIKGVGRDFSIRLNLFEDKVFANLTYFTTKAVNASSNAFTVFTWINDIWETLDEADIVSNPAYVVENAHDVENFKAEGYEFEIVANPNRNITLRLNVGMGDNLSDEIEPYLDRYLQTYASTWTPHSSLPLFENSAETIGSTLDKLTTRNDNNKNASGLQSEGHVEFRSNFFAKYSFLDGPLDGFSVGVGGRYRDGQNIGYYNDPAVNGVVAALGNSYFLVDLAFGYSTTIMNDSVDLSIRLNIKNLFNDEDIIWTEAAGDGSPKDYVLQPPREIGLSAQFEF